jgi:leucyl aminopeptidase
MFSLIHHQNDITNSEIIVAIPQKIDKDTTKKLIQEILNVYKINHLAIIEDFKAESREIQTIYTENTKIHLLGMGKDLKSKSIITLFRWFFHTKKTKLQPQISLDLSFLENESIQHAINGVLLGSYDINFYKTDKKSENFNFFQQENPKIQVVYAEIDGIFGENEAKNVVFEGTQTAFAQMEAMNLVNLPANIKTPQYIAEWAIKSGEKFGYKVEILDKNELEKQGLHALLAVGKGSNRPPYLIIMHYTPKNPKNTQENPKKIALVGKCLTFDMGGISIKDSQNMHFMKSDMAGAGGMMGAIELVARLGLDIEVIGVMCVAENNIGADAVLPSDVFSSYSGLTIEMIDTDAEGRVVLADGVTYANRNFKPDIMIDMATLTGNSILALGYATGALFCNNEELTEKLIKAGQNTQEKLWQMPLWDDYKDDISSDVADVRNFSGKPINGSISAAKFIEVFTEKHPAWAHIDMPGMGLQANEFAKDRNATAYGVRLLVDFLKNL